MWIKCNKKWNLGKDIRPTHSWDSQTDGQVDGRLPLVELRSGRAARIAAVCPARHFCHVYKIAIFPTLNLCNRGLKLRAVTSVQLLTTGAILDVWNMALSHIMLYTPVFTSVVVCKCSDWHVLMICRRFLCTPVWFPLCTRRAGGGAQSGTAAALSKGGNPHTLNMKWTSAPVKPFEVVFEFQKSRCTPPKAPTSHLMSAETSTGPDKP